MDWRALLLLLALPGLIGACWALALRIKQCGAWRHARLYIRELWLAEERSKALLRDVLDDREYQQLTQQGYLDIVSPSSQERVFRIPGSAGRVLLFDHGRAQAELCVQPIGPLPANDVIAVHKLMIVAKEQDYLACAKQIPLFVPQYIDQSD